MYNRFVRFPKLGLSVIQIVLKTPGEDSDPAAEVVSVTNHGLALPRPRVNQALNLRPINVSGSLDSS